MDTENITEKPLILYVDDEEDNLVVFKSAFRKYYKILTAASADEGMKVVKANPDLQVIITDQRMPAINGVEFLKSIIPTNPNPIRMVLSGFSDMEAVIKAINDGRIYRYIPKPWEEHDLKLAIDNAVELFNLQRQNRELMRHLAEYNKRLESTVEERTKELRQANQEKSELLGIVAHDLKNPLMGIMSLTEMLRNADEYSVPEEEKPELVQQLWASGNRMSDLIHGLLDMNAIDTGKMTVNALPFNLTSLASSVIADYKSRAEQKEQTLFSEFPAAASEATVIADERLMLQVLDNLVSNAVKYSPQGKQIWVRIKPSQILSGKQVVWLEVQDEGPGLSDKDKELLFGKFTRLSARPTGGESSTGLGLSIVKKMVEAMSGRVWCESELGRGATFIVELPAA
jgi:signal transduction histidine kinase